MIKVRGKEKAQMVNQQMFNEHMLHIRHPARHLLGGHQGNQFPPTRAWAQHSPTCHARNWGNTCDCSLSLVSCNLHHLDPSVYHLSILLICKMGIVGCLLH